MGSHLAAVLVLVGLLLLLGAGESLAHRRRLGRIPIRIHVNGTRGKSSVTRLIAAGLRAGGVPTCAKTTGTEAAMILPDGSEFPVYRPAGPNVIEQLRIVSTAASLGARALVIECMALQPLLQSLCELKLIRATHGVITNARPDHLELMGPGEADVAHALAGTTPVGGQLFSGESRHRDILQRAAADRGSELVEILEADAQAVSDEEMARFHYLEHRPNVAIALRVCTAVGVDRETALRGMWEAPPDPGVLTLHEVAFFGRRLLFANGFAANDPESTGRIWRMVVDRFPDVDRRIAIFNCRVDRPERSRQLGEACVGWPAADWYILMGSGTYIFARHATAHGLPVSKLVLAEGQHSDDLFETVVERAGRNAMVMGMGNTHGGGLELARLFRNRGALVELR